ncbi:MAG: 6-carboxytetrahydropterin synthase [Thermodesulfobacteriota bacterium]
METHVGMTREFHIEEHGFLTLELMIESRSGKLNSQTGQIMSRSDFRNLVNQVIEVKYNNKKLEDIPGLGYIPHTLEILAQRLWEDIEDALNYEARMSRIKVSNNNYFVIYDGRRDQERKRKPKLKPQTKTKTHLQIDVQTKERPSDQ